jgi:Sulfotransferase domain
MIYGLKFVFRYLLGLAPADRNLAVFPDDTFIVSYPRSGNTWTRFLLANILHPKEPVTFFSIEELIPDASAYSNLHLKRIPRPRWIKTHEYFDHRYKKVIYVVRDPRDVVISYYHFQRKYRHIPDDYPFETYVSDFIDGTKVSSSWGTWGENVGSWIGARLGTPHFLLLRYEDLVLDTFGELQRMSEFVGTGSDPGLISQAVERSSAERLKEMEKQQADQWISTRNKRPDIPFIRQAEAGAWRSKLSPESVSLIENAWGMLMQSLGYELTTMESPTGSGLEFGSQMKAHLSDGLR